MPSLSTNKIPKTIHQIWIGPRKPPYHLMTAWVMDGWDYRLWLEDDIEELKLVNQKKYDFYYDNEIYHGAANVARVEILKKHGGVYIDVDTERLKDFDENLLNNSFFAVEGNKVPGVAYRIANGVMGSVPDHPLLSDYIKEISEADKLLPSWDTTGGTMLTRIIKKYPDCTILEPYWFYPYSSVGTRHPKHKEAIARHYWGSKGGVYD